MWRNLNTTRWCSHFSLLGWLAGPWKLLPASTPRLSQAAAPLRFPDFRAADDPDAWRRQAGSAGGDPHYGESHWPKS